MCTGHCIICYVCEGTSNPVSVCVVCVTHQTYCQSMITLNNVIKIDRGYQSSAYTSLWTALNIIICHFHE